jgi:hypothetical protein
MVFSLDTNLDRGGKEVLALYAISLSMACELVQANPSTAPRMDSNIITIITIVQVFKDI